MDSYQWVGTIFLVLHVIYGSTTTVWFYNRRDLYPIKSRLPGFCLVHQVTFGLININLCLWMINHFNGPCIWYHWTVMSFTLFGASVYVVRSVQFYFRYKITKEIIQNRQEAILTSKQPTKIGWWTQRQKYITSTYLYKIYLNLIIGVIPVCGFFALAYPTLTHITANDSKCIPVFSFTQNPYFSVFCWLAVAIVGLCCYKSKDLEEGLWLRNEFIGCAVLVTTLHIVVFIPQFNTRHQHEAIAYILTVFAVNTLTYTVPTIMTYTYPKRRKRKIVDSEQSVVSHTNHQPSKEDSVTMRLSVYLQHPEHYSAFSNFVAKEFAVESLLFWKDATQTREFAKKNLPDLEASLPGHCHTANLSEDGAVSPSSNSSLYQMMQFLLKTYIETDAPHAINISFQLRTEMSKELRALNPQSHISLEEFDKIFKRAIKEVLEMLECDHFLRFVKSDFYVLNQTTLDQTSQDTDLLLENKDK